MKGDTGADVTCPVPGCGAVLHPRRLTYHAGRGVYDATPHQINRKAVRQHLLNAHPALSLRERSLLCDSAIAVEG